MSAPWIHRPWHFGNLSGLGEVLFGGALATLASWSWFFPPGKVSPIGAVFGIFLFGHGLLMLISGQFVSTVGSESDDERES
jgi:hypothetical protein